MFVISFFLLMRFLITLIGFFSLTWIAENFLSVVSVSAEQRVNRFLSKKDMKSNNSTVWECQINITRIYKLQPPELNTSFVLCGIVLLTIVLAGLVGNALSLLVFIRTTLKPKVYYYLIILTLWDILLLGSSFLLYSLPYLLYGGLYTFGPYVKIYPLCYAVSHVTHTGSIWSMIVFAVERYYALCRPLIYLKWNSKRRLRILLSLVALFAVIYRIPKFFELSLHLCMESESGQLITVLDKSDFRENTIYKSLYKVVGDSLFFSLGPLLTLLSLTIMVTMAFRRNKNFRRIETSTSIGRSFLNIADNEHFVACLESKPQLEENEDKSMNLMLVAVMVKYCICHTLPMVLNLCETIMHEERFNGAAIETLVDVSNILVVANSSCNIVIYLVFGLKFRASFKRILFRHPLCFTRNSRRRSSFRTIQCVSSWDLNTRKQFQKTSLNYSKSSMF